MAWAIMSLVTWAPTWAAAAAARFGMACEILLEDRTGYTHEDYRKSGNVILDRLLGANIRHVPAGTDMDGEPLILAKAAKGACLNTWAIQPRPST